MMEKTTIIIYIIFIFNEKLSKEININSIINYNI